LLTIILIEQLYRTQYSNFRIFMEEGKEIIEDILKKYKKIDCEAQKIMQ